MASLLEVEVSEGEEDEAKSDEANRNVYPDCGGFFFFARNDQLASPGIFATILPAPDVQAMRQERK